MGRKSFVSAAWPPERVERLRALAGEGLSASQIALKFGCGRSKIIAKCDRAGIQLGGKRLRARVIAARQAPAPSAPPLLPLPPLRIVHVESQPRTMLELQPHMCRWPLDLTKAESTAHSLFCGAEQTAGSSYCHAHEKLAHIPTQAKPAAFPSFERRRPGGRSGHGVKRESFG